MTALQLGFARAVDLALADLDAIGSRLPTFFDECWVPAAPNHDRPTRLRSADADPDHVPGPVWDCGLADHRAREGWKRMVVHLTAATQQSADVLWALVGRESRCVPSCRPASLLDAQLAVGRLRTILVAIRGHWAQMSGESADTPTWQVNVPRAQWLARQLMGERGHPQGSCFDHVEQARFDAQRVVREVGSGKPPATCRQCRRTGSIGRSRKGGLCDACYQRNYRLEARQRQVKVRHAKGA